jgi:ATP-dependent Clp protease ATP-binding subunit ClpB
MGGLHADSKRLRHAVMGALDRQFRPEFLNRLDDIIIFHSLDQQHILHIVAIQLQRLERLLAHKRVTLQLTPAARSLLAERGFDPVFGARPLKRVIQRELQDTLANALLSGQVRENDHVLVDADGSGEGAQLLFSTIAPQTA